MKNLLMVVRRKFVIITLFTITFLVCCRNADKDAQYHNPRILATHFNGEQFVGSLACRECHADVYEKHLKTAHFNTSALVNEENILGSFETGSNTLELSEIDFEMVKKGKHFYVRGTEKNSIEPRVISKFDVVIGSGVKGQSYLAWDKDQLFQLQPSYYPPADSWINSPGFPSSLLVRPIRDGCLKCHVTFAKNKDFSMTGNHFEKELMIYGVDCERCHRPAAKHVIYHRANPEDMTAKYMLKLDTLPRQQRLDVCSQCHSGLRDNLLDGNSFSFLSGEILDDYARNYYTGQTEDKFDVHGNQYGLLTNSECFKQTKNLDCRTCHDPHQNQRGHLAYFNQKCVACHSGASGECTAEAVAIRSMENNCIACHMPNSPSSLMTVKLTKDTFETPVYVRTHLIAIYPREQWHE